MSRRDQDEVDFACEAWAYQWMNLFARDPQKASEYLGRLGCTLNLVKILADGAGSGTVVSREFPEAFLGDGLLVNIAIKYMREAQREIIWRHYVSRWYFLRPIKDPKGVIEGQHVVRLVRPVKQGVIAYRMGISRAEYHHRRDAAKSFVRGLLVGEKCLDTKVGHEHAIPV